MMSYQPDKYLT